MEKPTATMVGSFGQWQLVSRCIVPRKSGAADPPRSAREPLIPPFLGVRAGQNRPKRRRFSSALTVGHASFASTKRPTWGSAADQGVRPTIYADARVREKLSRVEHLGCAPGGGPLLELPAAAQMLPGRPESKELGPANAWDRMSPVRADLPTQFRGADGTERMRPSLRRLAGRSIRAFRLPAEPGAAYRPESGGGWHRRRLQAGRRHSRSL